LADEPSPATKAQARVEEGLLKPLAESEGARSRFSRARPIPRERRVRITQATPTLDKSGRAFMTFAVDIRWGGDEWRENDIVGCVCTSNGSLFVKRGEEWRPGAFLLGKPGDPVQGVCQAPPVAKA
jgi:hypothetical protein